MVLIRRFDYHRILFLASYPNAHSRHFLAKELRYRLTGRDKHIEEPNPDPQLNPHVRRRWWKTPISTLLHRSTTLHDESDNESDTSKEDRKNRRVRPDMIRRIDDKPKLINPSGWISEGRMPTAREGLVEPTRSGSPIKEPVPTNSTLPRSPGPIHSQLSGQRSNDLEAESESELEDLTQIPPRGRTNRRVSDPGAFPHRKYAGWCCLLPIDITHSPSPTCSTTFISVPAPWPFCYSDSNRGIRSFPTSESSTPNEALHRPQHQATALRSGEPHAAWRQQRGRPCGNGK